MGLGNATDRTFQKNVPEPPQNRSGIYLGHRSGLNSWTWITSGLGAAGHSTLWRSTLEILDAG